VQYHDRKSFGYVYNGCLFPTLFNEPASIARFKPRPKNSFKRDMMMMMMIVNVGNRDFEGVGLGVFQNIYQPGISLKL
jgi:hypothetical protein